METLRALFAFSGNQCAFPGCVHQLINVRSQFIGQICHIEAANVGGERFNPHSNDEERRSFQNLILLCYAHHVETNDVARFDVQSMRGMKAEHEFSFSGDHYRVSTDILWRLKQDIEKFWQEIDRLKSEHLIPDFAIPVENLENGELFDSARESISVIDDIFFELRRSDDTLCDDVRELLGKPEMDLAVFEAMPYSENPFQGRNWEMLELASRNAIGRLLVLLEQLEVRFYEKAVEADPSDVLLRKRLERARNSLKDSACSAGLAD